MTMLDAFCNYVSRALRARRARILLRQAPKSVGKEILYR